MVGYYHIINRGVEQRKIYKDSKDFEMFLELLCSGCQVYNVQLHAYALMDNHYHLLVETKAENLSKFMKHINGSYAIYFNKKYARSGHLWQGRFKSWYVTDDAYLYALINYIEYNPVQVKMIRKLGRYKYSSYSSFIEKVEPIRCLRGSFVFEEFKNKKEREEFLQTMANESILAEIKKASNLVVTSVKDKQLDRKRLKNMFRKIKDSSERDQKIYQAHSEGYSQHAIAESIGLSQPQINRIIKKIRSIGIT